MAAIRDTDADWRSIGESQPYWGVLGQDKFRKENLDDEIIKDFFEAGQNDVDRIVAAVSRQFGGWPSVRRALDFGCGPGRLTGPMTSHSAEVFGCDVSAAMIDLARRRNTERTLFSNQLQDGPFDWINSYMVFQHIPPSRGLEILHDLLKRLSPEGFVTLHFTIYRDPEIPVSTIWIEGRLSSMLRALLRSRPVDQLVSMFDYDLTKIVQTMNGAGLLNIYLEHVNHGGHRGVWMIARRAGHLLAG